MMKIIQYEVNNSVFIKAEPTKLTPLPLNNDSDGYYLVIPSIVSELPDDIMFIAESILVPPHSHIQYYPKMVKMGVSLSQSIATKITTGIVIKLIVIDNINEQITVNESYTIKTGSKRTPTPQPPAPVSDGITIKADPNTLGILTMIDKQIDKREKMYDNNIVVKNSKPDVVISESYSSASSIIDETPKRKRGRPPKKKVELNQEEINNILIDDENEDIED